MLKIKNNVDLKELEKFGIVKFYDKSSDMNFYQREIQYKDCESRRIRYYHEDGCHLALEQGEYVFDDRLVEILYDLIKADLVEKFEE